MNRIEKWKTHRIYWESLALQCDALSDAVAGKSNEPKKYQKRREKCWKRYNKYDKKLYRYEQKQWQKCFVKLAKEWQPYSAYYYIPAVMEEMLKRCNDYWHHRYNVHVVDEETDKIRKQLDEVMEILDIQEVNNEKLTNVRLNTDEGRALHSSLYQKSRDLDVDLFSHVAQYMDDWCD